MPPNIPTEEVLEMQRNSMSHEQIVDSLHQKGFSSQQIMDAINQAELNQSAGMAAGSQNIQSPLDTAGPSPQMPEMGAPGLDTSYQQFPQQRAPQPQRNIEEQIEEITEAIIDEKWDELTKDMGNLSLWKESIQTELESVKQEVLRVEGRLEKLQQAVLSRVEQYNQTLTNVDTEMKALGKVFEKIIQPLTSNIKELSRITADLKKKK